MLSVDFYIMEIRSAVREIYDYKEMVRNKQRKKNHQPWQVSYLAEKNEKEYKDDIWHSWLSN